MNARTRQLGPAAALALVGLALAGPAHAHGGEDEALDKMPARALAQQAFALLSQKGKAVEAHERVEAALASKERADVDIRALRQVPGAFEAGDHERATRLLSQALAAPDSPAGKPSARTPAMPDGESGEGKHAERMPAGSETRVSADALDHRPEFRPARAAAEWVAAGVGAVALAAALGLLALPRRRRA